MAIDPKNIPRKSFINRQFEDGRPLGNDSIDSKGVFCDDDSGTWISDRIAIHNEVISRIEAGFEGIPCERRAVFLGGEPGVGKSFFRQNVSGLDQGYAQLDPDHVRDVLMEVLQEHGIFPEVEAPIEPGFTPRELSGYFHREATDIFEVLYANSVAADRNIVVDTSMGNEARIMGYLDQIKTDLPEDQRYIATQILLQAEPTVVDNRGADRYRYGLDHDQLGGRLAPASLNDTVRTNAPGTFMACLSREDGFDESYKVDVTAEPHIISAWQGREQIQELPHMGQLDFSQSVPPMQYLADLEPDAREASLQSALDRAMQLQEARFAEQIAPQYGTPLTGSSQINVVAEAAGIDPHKVPIVDPLIDPNTQLGITPEVVSTDPAVVFDKTAPVYSELVHEHTDDLVIIEPGDTIERQFIEPVPDPTDESVVQEIDCSSIPLPLSPGFEEASSISSIVEPSDVPPVDMRDLWDPAVSQMDGPNVPMGVEGDAPPIDMRDLWEPVESVYETDALDSSFENGVEVEDALTVDNMAYADDVAMDETTYEVDSTIENDMRTDAYLDTSMELGGSESSNAGVGVDAEAAPFDAGADIGGDVGFDGGIGMGGAGGDAGFGGDGGVGMGASGDGGVSAGIGGP